MEENTQHFWHIMLYYLKKGKIRNWNAKKKKKEREICAVYRKGAVTDWTRQKWLQSFMPEISRWMILHSW